MAYLVLLSWAFIEDQISTAPVSSVLWYLIIDNLMNASDIMIGQS